MDARMKFSTSIGIDISKKKCDYCVLDSDGNVIETGQYQNTIKDANAFAQEMARKYRKTGCRAACESTANLWKATYRAIEATGMRIILANTFKMALITKSAKKTDREDAHKIADLLRINMIEACHVATPEVSGVRTLIRHHVKLTQERTKVINRIHSALDAYNMTIQSANMYSRKGIKQLEGTVLGTPYETFVLQKDTQELQSLTGLLAETDQYLERVAAYNADARLLISMPGIGSFVALLLAVEIDGIARFKNPKKLVSMAGLCPVISESGDVSRMNHIKKQNTNDLANWALCEAAQVAVMHDPKMKAYYESVKKRHAGKHALGIVAVAHKMITIIWHILTTRKPYESRNEALYQRKLDRLNRARCRKV